MAHPKVSPALLSQAIAIALKAGWTDTEIARQAGLSTSTVAHWRRRLGFGVATRQVRFQRKFAQRYGPEAIERFCQLYEETHNLATVAERFGFSREYARQVRNILYASEKRVEISGKNQKPP